MKPNRNNLLLLGALSLALATPSAFAADLNWDAGNTANGATINPANGTWNTTAGNIVWNNAGTNVIWSAANVAVFGGADGTYAITVGGSFSAQKIQFNNSGYTLSSAAARTITLTSPGGTSERPGVSIASGITATIGANVLVQGNATTYVGANNGTAGGTLNIEGTSASALGQVRTSTNNSLVIDGAGTILNVKNFGYFAPVSTASSSIAVGQLASSDATLNVEGGTVEVFNTGSFQVGNQGKGTVNLNSGALKVGAASTNGVVLGVNVVNVSSSVFNLNGGTLTTSMVKKGPATGSTDTFNFNGGTLVANNSAANATFMEGLDFANVKAGGAKIQTSGQDITINQTLLADSPSGGLTKSGTGTLTLTGANTYTGDTLVNAGTLSASNIVVSGGNSNLGNATSAVTLGSAGAQGTLSYTGNTDTYTRGFTIGGAGGGRLDVTTSGQTLSVGTGDVTGSGLFTVGGAGNTSITANLTHTGGLTKTGAGTLTLTGANTYTGDTTINSGTLDLGGGTASGSLASPTLTLAGGSFSYTRTGSNTQGFTTTNINASGASQISVGAGNTLNLGTVVRGAGVSFDFSTTGAGTVAALTSNNVNGIMPGFTFGDTWAVANGDGVAISGLSSYTLTSVAGTTGTSYLNANIDVDNNAGLIDAAIAAYSLRFNSPAANTLTLATGPNTIDLGGILVGSAVGSNLSTITGGTLTGGISQNLTIFQNNTAGGLTISSSIVDNTLTSVTKFGAGLLTLDAANTYTGGTTINAGTLKLSGAGTPGAAGSRVAVSSGAVLDLNGTNQSITLAAGTGVGTAANNSGSGTSVLTLTATSSTDGSFLTIADSTSTPGGKVAVIITKNTQTPSNLNTYSGGTTVNAGAFFYVNGASPNGAGTGTITLPAGTGSTATSSGLLVDGTTYANDITGAGYVHNNTNGTATAVFTGTVNTSGTFNFRNAAAAFDFAGSGNSTLSGVIGPAGAGGAFGPNTTVSTGSIIKSGSGTLTLTGANLYSGTTTISGGILNANSTSALGSGGTNNTLIFNGGTLQAGGTITSPGTRKVTLTSTGLIDTNSNDVSIAGIISGADGLTKSGAGTLTLSGANTYTGNTSVSAGILALADNAQLKFVLGATSGSNNSLSGAGTATLDGDFVIDTAAADALATGTWTLVDHATLTESYTASFTVSGFTPVGSTQWEKPNGLTKKYTFDETTGVLTLGPSASYASWIDGFFPGVTDPLIIGAAADPDNDGIDNGVEMIIGGNPATGMDAALLPTIELVNADPDGDATFSDYLLFTYRRSDLSVTAGVTADCETDTNLVAPWTAATGAPGVVILVDNNFTFTPPAAADTDRVRVYVPRNANTKLFGRLNVQIP